MIRDEIESVETASPTILVEQTEQLKLIFPQVFSEGKIDFKKLRAALGDMVDTQPERYSFTWAGKRNATLLLQTPSYATLTPSEEESVNFENTQNQFIEGDNLEVLKLLCKSYSGRVKMIYIDPPYNTGNDFVYPDNYADPLETYLEITGQKDANGNLLISNPETSGRYHSAWLSMMYPRLYVARQLLKDDGALFISIDDHEVHNLRMLMNEIFGEENFVATLVWQKSKKGDAKLIANTHEYILVFCKNKNSVLQNGVWRRKKAGAEEVLSHYEHVKTMFKGDHTAISSGLRAWYNSLPKDDPRRSHAHYYWSDDRGLYFAADFAGPDDGRVSRPRYDIIHPITGKPCKKPSTGWRWDEERTKKALAAEPPLIHFGPDETTIPCRKSYLFEIDTEPFTSVFYKDGRAATLELEKLVGQGLLDFPKNTDVIKELIELVTDRSSIVLDFFAGSCTTAQAVLELNHEDNGNRQFVMVQLPEPTHNPQFPTIADIGKERIRRVIANLRGENDSKLDLSSREEPEDLGFRVFKLAPSNYKQWKSIDASDPEAYSRQLDLFADLLVEHWVPINVLWEVAIKEGYGLNAQLEKLEEVQGNTVWRITDPDKDQSMLVCLDDELKPSALSALPLSKEQVFVCRNKALDDTKAANLALQCRLKKI